MTLTWHIGGDVEPAATSWAALLPPAKGDEAVYEAMRAGHLTVSAIAEATRTTTAQVSWQLTKLQRRGLIASNGKGRFATWRVSA